MMIRGSNLGDEMRDFIISSKGRLVRNLNELSRLVRGFDPFVVLLTLVKLMLGNRFVY